MQARNSTLTFLRNFHPKQYFRHINSWKLNYHIMDFESSPCFFDTYYSVSTEKLKIISAFLDHVFSLSKDWQTNSME